jgi:hypothetical protein
MEDSEYYRTGKNHTDYDIRSVARLMPVPLFFSRKHTKELVLIEPTKLAWLPDGG